MFGVVKVVKSKVVSRFCVSMQARVPWYESVQSFNGVGDLTIQRCQHVKRQRLHKIERRYGVKTYERSTVLTIIQSNVR